MAQKFQPSEFLEYLKKIPGTSPQLQPMVSFLQQSTLMMNELSSVLSMAFSDIDDKQKILNNHSQKYQTQNLFEIIEKEIQQNLQELNGENNSKINKNQKDYVSAARTVNVLLRFFKFLRKMFEQLQVNQNFKDIVKDCYKTELGPHHPWLIRQAAQAGLSASPKIEKVLMMFSGDSKAQFRELEIGLSVLIDQLQQFYEKNNLLGLP